MQYVTKLDDAVDAEITAAHPEGVSALIQNYLNDVTIAVRTAKVQAALPPVEEVKADDIAVSQAEGEVTFTEAPPIEAPAEPVEVDVPVDAPVVAPVVTP